jgi:hypothetical protein
MLSDAAMRHEIPLQAGIDAPSTIDEKQLTELGIRVKVKNELYISQVNRVCKILHEHFRMPTKQEFDIYDNRIWHFNYSHIILDFLFQYSSPLNTHLDDYLYKNIDKLDIPQSWKDTRDDFYKNIQNALILVNTNDGKLILNYKVVYALYTGFNYDYYLLIDVLESLNKKGRITNKLHLCGNDYTLKEIKDEIKEFVLI